MQEELLIEKVGYLFFVTLILSSHGAWINALLFFLRCEKIFFIGLLVCLGVVAIDYLIALISFKPLRRLH